MTISDDEVEAAKALILDRLNVAGLVHPTRAVHQAFVAEIARAALTAALKKAGA